MAQSVPICHTQECLVCKDFSPISMEDCHRRPHEPPRYGLQYWDDQVFGCRHEKCPRYNPNAGPPSNANEILRRPAAPFAPLPPPQPAGPFAPITQGYGGYRQRSPQPRRSPQPQYGRQPKLSPQPSQASVSGRQPQTASGNNSAGSSLFLAPNRPSPFQQPPRTSTYPNAPTTQPSLGYEPVNTQGQASLLPPTPLFRPSTPLRRSHSPVPDRSPTNIGASGSKSAAKPAKKGAVPAFHEPPVGRKMPPTSPLPAKRKERAPQWTTDESEMILKMQITHGMLYEIGERPLKGRSEKAMKGRLAWLRNNPEDMERARNGTIFRTWNPPPPPPRKGRGAPPSLPSQGRSLFDNTKPKRGGDDDDGSGGANVGGFKAIRT